MPGKTAAPPRKPHKEKRSFTLSRSSVQFLERLRRQTATSSTSLVLDHLIREAERRQTEAGIEAAISTYYSNLNAEEEAEQRLWGKFALEQ
jgi:hypothetical protein